MNVFGKANLRELLEQAPQLGVSIYMPTHRAGRETQQDRIRLKNLLTSAEDRITAGGATVATSNRLLAPAWALVDDAQFWLAQRDGLAVFLANGFERKYRLPLKFPERVTVGPRFYIKPLLPLFTEEGHYFVLALSQKEARLLVGTRDNLEQLDLEGAPAGMASLRAEDGERSLTHHTSTASRQRSSVIHGGGGAEEDHAEDLRRYFREVDQAIGQLLREEHAPLVLAAVESHLPVFREISEYPNILPQPLAGNPDELSAHELHARSWDIVRPYFSRHMQAAAERFSNQLGTGQASGQIEDVVKAAYEGRVEYLFVPTGAQRWGTFDQDTLIASLQAELGAGSQDLLDLACEYTLKHGGVVYALKPDQMPQACQVAAGFRY